MKGTSLAEFFRRRLADALVFGKSFIAIDFPKLPVSVDQPRRGRRTGQVAGLPHRIFAPGTYQLGHR